MFVSKIKTVTALLLLLAALALGAGGLLYSTHAAGPQPAKADRPPRAADKSKEPLDSAFQLVKDSDATPYEKARLLAEIGGAQARRGARKEADKAFEVALGLVKGIKNDVYKAGALGSIARNQLLGDDLKAARKTLAAVEGLRDKTKDNTVRLNATLIADGILTSIAAAQARLGKIPDALKTASKIGNSERQILVYGKIAREQANRKDFAGAVKTVEQTESVRIPHMLFEIARIQEMADKPGAVATWKRCLEALLKLELSEEDDLVADRGGIRFREMLPALVKRGQGAAVRRWIDGLPSVAVKVRLLLILAGNG